MRKQLWDYYYTELAKAVDVGYDPASEMYDPELAQSLKYNIAEFSAFKETSFRQQLESKLTRDGGVVGWKDFLAEARKLDALYNKRWLKTEYDQTVARANMALQFADFERDKDIYPNLRIVAIKDERTREKHRALDGVTLPVDHAFWKTHTPPFDWGCRCRLVQTAEEADKKAPKYDFKPEHEINPFYSGAIFSGNPYESNLPKAEVLSTEKQGKRYLENKILKTERSKQFVTVHEAGDGKVLEHLLLKKRDDHPDIRLAAQLFARDNKIAELMPEIHAKEKTIRNILFPNLRSKTANPDLKIGKMYFDVKRPESVKNIVGNAIKASKQGAIAIISDSKMNNGLNQSLISEKSGLIFNDKNYSFDIIYFLTDGELIAINRTGA